MLSGSSEFSVHGWKEKGKRKEEKGWPIKSEAAFIIVYPEWFGNGFEVSFDQFPNHTVEILKMEANQFGLTRLFPLSFFLLVLDNRVHGVARNIPWTPLLRHYRSIWILKSTHTYKTAVDDAHIIKRSSAKCIHGRKSWLSSEGSCLNAVYRKNTNGRNRAIPFKGRMFWFLARLKTTPL